ncbi:GTPase [Micromonospora craterilacus]|uniref:GTPase n=1 Tax=Micromonospora craterilacus TaxID=1655439 RepID=A0A2W2F012_9ACTN|nr:GTPase [Micromonospora craterilacus]
MAPAGGAVTGAGSLEGGSTLGVDPGAGARVERGSAGADDGSRLGAAGTAEAEGDRDVVLGARVPLVVRGAAGVRATGASAAGCDGAGGGCHCCWVGSTKGSTVSGLTGPPAKLATTSPV